ncbi:MAG TPA: hypothetical protein VJ044_13220, partial [Candidatus Hodarchaeales archaeon]|nr:hypothetical protein [Candidatus Hodarchaeales archaeon]
MYDIDGSSQRNRRNEQQSSQKPPIRISFFPPIPPQGLQASIVIKTEIRPSEKKDAVIKAVRTLFPLADLSVNEQQVSLRTEDFRVLDHFSKRLLDQQILDAVRKAILRGTAGKSLTTGEPTFTEFYLNKQPALLDRVVVCGPDEAPL